MSRLDDRRLARLLDSAPAAEPPDGLLEELRRQVPEQLGRLPQMERPAPPPARWRRYAVAASLVTVLGGGWLAWQVAREAPPLGEGVAADRALPVRAAPSATSGESLQAAEEQPASGEAAAERQAVDEVAAPGASSVPFDAPAPSGRLESRGHDPRTVAPPAAPLQEAHRQHELEPESRRPAAERLESPPPALPTVPPPPPPAPAAGAAPAAPAPDEPAATRARSRRAEPTAAPEAGRATHAEEASAGRRLALSTTDPSDLGSPSGPTVEEDGEAWQRVGEALGRGELPAPSEVSIAGWLERFGVADAAPGSPGAQIAELLRGFAGVLQNPDGSAASELEVLLAEAERLRHELAGEPALDELVELLARARELLHDRR